MYSLIFDNKAIEFPEKCEKKLGKRIWNKIQITKTNPYKFFERLTGRTDYKLRIGDYRVIADINTLKKEINITLIGHRKNVYRK